MSPRVPRLAAPVALIAAFAGLAGFAGRADAQVRSVEVRTPHPFGVFVGDLVEAQVDILADPGFTVQPASLPQPGAVAYWLDLRRISVEEAPSGGGRRIRLRLTYQNFYASLDARTLEVPGFPLTLASESAGGVTTAGVQVPAWSLGVSPLREVQPQRREDPAEYLRPDGLGRRIDPAPLVTGAAVLAPLALLAACGLAYDRAWGPFRRRGGRPFAAALRTLRRQRGGAEPDQAYRAALLALHRGLDQTDGRRVLADDLGAFLDRHAAFRAQGPGLSRFFAASRLAFFGGRVAAARADWPLGEAEAVLARLAAAERGREAVTQLIAGYGATDPWVLWLLPLALLPLALSAQRRTAVSALSAAPADPLSAWIGRGLTLAGILALAGLIVALAGPYRVGERITRIGIGAQVSLLIDRSGSMNETFAGKQPSGAEESKAAASRRILGDFVGARAHDVFAVTAFSTAPMLVMPMTDRHAAIRAAIAAIDRPGLDYTNIGRGLGMALAQFGVDVGASRALVLVSDGAAVIDPRIQDQLRAAFARIRPNLYWLFLRTKGSPGIGDRPQGEDTPQAAPERHLDLFFRSLAVPYRAFEAEGADAVAAAIRQIEALERDPIPYVEERPRRDLTGSACALAALGLGLLVLAKLAEADFAAAPHAARDEAAESDVTDVPVPPARRAA